MSFQAQSCLSEVFSLGLKVAEIGLSIDRLILSPIFYNRHSCFLVLVVIIDLLLKFFNLFLLVIIFYKLIVLFIYWSTHFRQRHNSLPLVIWFIWKFINFRSLINWAERNSETFEFRLAALKIMSLNILMSLPLVHRVFSFVSVCLLKWIDKLKCFFFLFHRPTQIAFIKYFDLSFFHKNNFFSFFNKEYFFD